MRRRVLITMGLTVLIVGGYSGLVIWENANRPMSEALFEMTRAETAEMETDFVALFEEERSRRAECEKETQDWRYRECIESIPSPTIFVGHPNTISKLTGPSPSLIRRADAGEIEASLEYGYHLVGRAAVENTVPDAAIPYLMTAALAGDLGAHVQLALIETVSKSDGDLIRAWAHFDIALRVMPQSAPDYRRSQMHFDEIDSGLTDAQRATARTLSAEYSETMRANRNALK